MGDSLVFVVRFQKGVAQAGLQSVDVRICGVGDLAQSHDFSVHVVYGLAEGRDFPHDAWSVISPGGSKRGFSINA